MGGGTNSTNKKTEDKIGGIFAAKRFFTLKKAERPDPALVEALKQREQAAVEQEQQRQNELANELAQQALETAPNQEEVDLDKELAGVNKDFDDGDGPNVKAQEQTVAPETDSDEIKEDEWPHPRDHKTIEAVDAQMEDILNTLQAELQVEQMKSLKIQLDQVKNLVEGDEDQKEQAEAFNCVSCKRFPVPDFVLGKEGVKKESVKLGQCKHCSGISCYSCIKEIAGKKDPVCPKCRFRMEEIPIDLHKEQDPAVKSEQLDKHINLVTQKILLKMLFKQQIFHSCPILKKGAIVKAQGLWTQNISQMKMKANEIKNKEDEKQKKLSDLDLYYKKQTEKRQQQLKIDKKEREEDTQRYDNYLADLEKDKEIGQTNIEKAEAKMGQELGERDTKKQQLQDEYEKAKQDSIREVNKKHDEIDKQKVVLEKMKKMQDKKKAANKLIKENEEKLEQQRFKREEEQRKIQETEQSQRLETEAENKRVEKLNNLEKFYDAQEQKYAEEEAEAAEEERKQKELQEQQEKEEQEAREAQEAEEQERIEQEKKEAEEKKQKEIHEKAEEMTENLKDQLFEEVAKKEKDIYFDGAGGSEAGSAAGSARQSAVQEDENMSQIGSVADQINDNESEQMEGGSAVGSDEEEDQNLMTREDEIQSVIVKYDELIAEKLRKEDAGWIIRKEQLENDVANAKLNLQGILQDWEDGKKVVERQAKENEQAEKKVGEDNKYEQEKYEFERSQIENEDKNDPTNMDSSFREFLAGILIVSEEYPRFRGLSKKDEEEVRSVALREIELAGPPADDDQDELSKIEQEFSEIGEQREVTTLNAETDEEKEFAKNKEAIIDKIADTLYNREYRYIEYLNHKVTECEGASQVENGCPLAKCKFKKTCGIKELREHLANDCTKIDMQCSNCKDVFKRPYMKYHDCSNVFEKRVEDQKNERIKLFNIFEEQKKMLEGASSDNEGLQKLLEEAQVQIDAMKQENEKTLNRVSSELEIQKAEKERIEKEKTEALQMIALKEKQFQEQLDDHELAALVSRQTTKTKTPAGQLKMLRSPSPRKERDMRIETEGHRSQGSMNDINIPAFQMSEMNYKNGRISPAGSARSVRSKKSQMIPEKNWDVNVPESDFQAKTASIVDILKRLQSIEKDLSDVDKYVEYIVKKYKPFKFDVQLFLKDDQIGKCKYMEQEPVHQGQFQGYLYWGQILPIESEFKPHGFGVFVDIKSKILQMGSFKNGAEVGQQRIIQSFPLKQRQLTQFTSASGLLHGPALIERATGKQEIGSYDKNLQHGLWKYKYLNGNEDSEYFNKGKVMSKEDMQKLLLVTKQKSQASQGTHGVKSTQGLSPKLSQSPKIKALKSSGLVQNKLKQSDRSIPSASRASPTRSSSQTAALKKQKLLEQKKAIANMTPEQQREMLAKLSAQKKKS